MKSLHDFGSACTTRGLAPQKSPCMDCEKNQEDLREIINILIGNPERELHILNTNVLGIISFVLPSQENNTSRENTRTRDQRLADVSLRIRSTEV
jgi:hypothetical protein